MKALLDNSYVAGVSQDDTGLEWPNMTLATQIDLSNSRVKTVEDVNLQILSGSVLLDTCPKLTEVNLPALAMVGGLHLTFADVLAVLSMPALTLSGGMLIENNPFLALVSLPALTKLTGDTYIATNVSLVTLDISNLAEIAFGGSLNLADLPMLGTVNLNGLLGGGGVLHMEIMPATTVALGNVLELGALELSSFANLTTLSVPVLQKLLADFQMDTFALLTTLSTPKLAQCQSISIGNMTVLPAIALPLLTNLGTSFSVTSCPLLTSLSIPLLATAGTFEVRSCPLLVTFDFHLLAGATTYTIKNNAAMTGFTLPASFTACTNFDGSGNALLQAKVDAILAALDAGGVINGTVDLSGGTNATPSGAGLTSAANLVGKGWTVSHN